eukprot:TRINITY_DN28713_c0_g1_i1.p1 TRINITY_DN28713_c0_g1~~TRINITY_DN28713_c0_g1_i1.p1  ORF type:complete len:516 (-),score=108.07 TRINITY_DN28713_c0_g1_i1:97-1575(-)
MWLFRSQSRPREATRPAAPVDEDCLHKLARDAGAAFAAALERFAEQERERWARERRKVEQDRERLEHERALFEEEKLRYGPQGTQNSETVRLNVGGEAVMDVSRGVFTQCEGSMLAAEFSGRWERPTDADGRIFVDFPVAVFDPLVQHLRLRQMANGESIPVPPVLPDPALDDLFVNMLEHYDVLDWVYRQAPVEPKVVIGDYAYSVLPPQDPKTAKALIDMRGMTVRIPRGWRVVSADLDGFEETLSQVLGYSWGAGMLLVSDRQGSSASFSGYRTNISTSGVVGSKFENPPAWFDSVSEDGSTLKFAGSSYRLLIRAHARSRAAEGSRCTWRPPGADGGKTSSIADTGGRSALSAVERRDASAAKVEESDHQPSSLAATRSLLQPDAPAAAPGEEAVARDELTLSGASVSSSGALPPRGSKGPRKMRSKFLQSAVAAATGSPKDGRSRELTLGPEASSGAGGSRAAAPAAGSSVRSPATAPSPRPSQSRA